MQPAPAQAESPPPHVRLGSRQVPAENHPSEFPAVVNSDCERGCQIPHCSSQWRSHAHGKAVVQGRVYWLRPLDNLDTLPCLQRTGVEQPARPDKSKSERASP